MKRCSSCGEDKPLDQFGSNRAKKDGLSVYCRECTRARLRARYHADPEASREKLRQRYRANPEKYRSMKAAEYARNPERYRRRARQRYVISRYAGTMPPWKVAERLGVSEHYVHQIAQRLGISMGFHKPRWTPEQDAELLRLRQQGMTQKAISERMGRSLEAIKAQLRKLQNQ